MCAEKAALLITLPPENIASPGMATKSTSILKAVTSNASEGIYSYPCPYGTTAPSFDWEDPLTGGWLSGKVADACYLAIKVPETEFCSAQGQRTVVLTMQASDPQTTIKVPAGTEMTARAEISNLRGEGNTGDNQATSTTKVPAMDLRITIQ
jgi:hypothetical protein